MSSRFVPAGGLDKPVERDDAWSKAQEELEANRKRKAEEASRQEGKSLYEILEANKAAKQEAFEEAAKLKNQFRSLDEDEVEFLDSVLESTRAQEAAVRKDTADKLAAFRKHQEDAERAALTGTVEGGDEVWAASGKKRKRNGKDKAILKGVKLRRTSETGEENKAATGGVEDRQGVKGKSEVVKAKAAISPATTPARLAKDTAATPDKLNETKKSSASPPIGLGLGNYSSDEDD